MSYRESSIKTAETVLYYNYKNPIIFAIQHIHSNQRAILMAAFVSKGLNLVSIDNSMSTLDYVLLLRNLIKGSRPEIFMSKKIEI